MMDQVQEEQLKFLEGEKQNQVVECAGDAKLTWNTEGRVLPVLGEDSKV